MQVRDRLILIALTAVWGMNFSVIAIALRDLPPLLLGALRFALVAFPAVLVLPRPTAPWRHVAAYGLTTFALQFGFLFAGMSLGVGAGVASLALQFQVFVTMGLALWFGRERAASHQLVGVIVGACGLLTLVADYQKAQAGPGLVLVLLAAVSWGVGNTLSRRLLQGQAVLSLVAWGSLFSVPPIALASLWLEGWTAWAAASASSSPSTWLAVAYIVYPTTLLGFAVWAWQLRLHPAASVAPFTMLVPVFGLTFSRLITAEAVSILVVLATALVLTGVAFSQWGDRIIERLSQVRRARS